MLKIITSLMMRHFFILLHFVVPLIFSFENKYFKRLMLLNLIEFVYTKEDFLSKRFCREKVI